MADHHIRSKCFFGLQTMQLPQNRLTLQTCQFCCLQILMNFGVYLTMELDQPCFNSW